MAIEEKEKKGLLRAAGIVSGATLISRALGLVREVVIARAFGTTPQADAFFVAFRIPNLLRELFAEGSVSAAFIPVFTEYLATGSKEAARKLARAVFSTAIVFLLLVSIGGILVSRGIVFLMAPGFHATPGKFDLTVRLTEMMFPFLLFIGLTALAMGILNTVKVFGPPAFSPAFFNLCMISAVLFLCPLLLEPVFGLAVGVVIGGLAQFLIQVPSLRKHGFPLTFRWEPTHPGVRKIGLLIIPVMMGVSVSDLNILINNLLASFLEEGSVSYLNYGMRLIHFPVGLVGVALSTALLPSLSAHAARKALGDLRESLSFGLRLALFLAVPATVGLMILRIPIVHLLFQHGVFDAQATAGTATAVLYYAVGLWAFVTVRIIVQAFYALQDTATPVKIAAVAVGVNIFLNLLLMGPLRHGGLALATSLSSMVNVALLLISLRKKLGRMDGRRIRAAFLRILLACSIVAALTWPVSALSLWKEGGAWTVKALLLLGDIAMSCAAYLLVHALLRSEEFRFLKDFVLGKKEGSYFS